MIKVIAVVLVGLSMWVGANIGPQVEDMPVMSDIWCETHCARCHGSY